MDTQPEKIYVAIGTDMVDGFGALEWALKTWSSQLISIVILHAANNICKDYVYTPFGKLPASSVSEVKLKALEKSEQAKTDKILQKFVAHCGKVKAEIHKIDRDDKPLHELVLELISSLRITKLVMAFTFMKSTTWKSRSVISGTFYVHRHKPEYCELFLICGGKLVFLRGEREDDGLVEDDQGVMVAKLREKNSFMSWLGKMLPHQKAAYNDKTPITSPSSSTGNDSPNQWAKYNTEIQHYFNQLLLSLDEEDRDYEVEYDILLKSSEEPDVTENKVAEENIEALKTKISSIQETIELQRKDAKVYLERQRKAEWAISLSTSRAEELEACIQIETAKRIDIQKEVECRKEELIELETEVEQKRTKLNSVMQLQHELSRKLQSSSLAKSHAEVQLEKAVRTRSEMVQEIEELRRQRDVLQRRIDFCKEKDAIGQANMISETSFGYREFTASEIRAATRDFSGSRRLKCGDEWMNVYKGRIDHITVAIKLYNPSSQEAFQSEVKLLGSIRHPHLVGMIGFCSELNCIVFEYMHNGCLRDTLFSSTRSSRKKRHLSWHARIRIAAEVCKALAFLHQVQPKPIVHGSLNPSKILLDCHNVAKIHGYKVPSSSELDTTPDIHAFGNLVLQLLTGRNWVALEEDAVRKDTAAIIGFLDDVAGEWPQDLAIQFCSIALKCLSTLDLNKDLTMNRLMNDVIKVKEKADQHEEKVKCAVSKEEDTNEDSGNVPSVFLCPIYQDVMKNPHVAADGFSYELEAIEGWLATGHDTSPMTNLQLNHKLLTPNKTLRSLIHDWHNKRSIPFA